MRCASWSRWLLLLAGLGAVSGCAEMSSAGFTHGQSAYAVSPSDPRFVAARDPSLLAEARAEKRWAGKRDGRDTASTPALAAAPMPEATPREPPVVATGAIRMSELQPVSSPPVTAASGTTTRRSLWDKQPWEIELDKIVRSICRGC
jgi:hypothetical protein